MYSDSKTVQILFSLLKQFNIRNIVVSPGSRHTPLICAISEDSFFKTYSVVDERSAAFFALGLITVLCEPVAICCTSGTAACNYMSAVTEAYYERLPLLLLTADHDPRCLNQQEVQMVPQMFFFEKVTKKNVSLPVVKDREDFVYCTRLVNDALLELDHHGKGPVQINFPVENIADLNTPKLPFVRKINRLSATDDREAWAEKARELKAASSVLVLYGLSAPISEEEKKTIEAFARKYRCVISTGHYSNLHCTGAMNTFSVVRTCADTGFKELKPDIVISVHGFTNPQFHALRGLENMKHWYVAEDGELCDPYYCLSDVFECSAAKFFSLFAELGGEDLAKNEYYAAWDKRRKSIVMPEIRYSNFSAIQKLMARLPESCLFHAANKQSEEHSQVFPLSSGSNVYCNLATTGIDGSLSTFIGQAYASGRLSFLVIGDLSFFYDMNGLWNSYIGNNVRIMMLNNNGSSTFQYNPGKDFVPDCITGEHDASAKGWVESRDFRYLSASNMDELDTALEAFTIGRSDAPIFLEVFTDKRQDAICAWEVEKLNIHCTELPCSTPYKLGEQLLFTQENTAKSYCVFGFSANERTHTWTDGSLVAMRIPISDYKAGGIVVNLFFLEAFGGEQRLIVSAGGKEIGAVTAYSTEGKASFRVPTAQIRDNILEFQLDLPDSKSPFELGLSADRRRLGLCLTAVSLLLD